MEFKISRLIASTFVNNTHPLQTWAPPRRLSVKINVDAAIGPFHSSIALVARDWRGDLVFACSKKAKTTFPLQAEAEAVRWLSLWLQGWKLTMLLLRQTLRFVMILFMS